MAFRAVHAQWGTVFAHLPDLGCGRSWGEVWKVKLPAPLTCAECEHTMYAKTSRTFGVALCHGGSGALVSSRAENGAAFMIPTPLPFR